MEEKKKIKISLKTALFLVIVFVLSVIILSGLFIKNKLENSTNFVSCDTLSYYLDNPPDIGFLNTNEDEKTKYYLISDYTQYSETINSIDEWVKDASITISTGAEKGSDLFERYKNKNRDWTLNRAEHRSLEQRAEKIKNKFAEGNYNKKYFKKYSLLLVENLTFNSVLYDGNLDDICINNEDLNVTLDIETGNSADGGEGRLFFITLLKKNLKNVNQINVNYKVGGADVVYKPIIYLYPTREENVSVKLLYDDMITVSYPKYTKGWDILAQKDGSLIDLTTNRNLYSLYYEAENTVDFKVEKDGFIVKGEDSATFLEEKLFTLGLTEREAEEFIIYWLPKLEANKYNYIRFATNDEINKNMPIEINPNPDTIIRVLMTYKGLDKPIEINEQKLTTPDRNGFVAVEWGGTEIN